MQSSCVARKNTGSKDNLPVMGKGCSLLVSTVACVGVSLNVAANDPVVSDSEQRLFEGDIIVENQPQLRSIGVPDATKIWPDGVVPFIIDPALPAANVQSITAAVGYWNSVSAITLLDVSGTESIAQGHGDYVKFVPGEFCASWVGKRGGEQELWVAPNCSAGSLMHEIGHALGLEHEHTRHDRNDFITIHWDNIDPARVHNFDAAPTGSRNLGAYDYESIMHYGPDNFSMNGQPTISVKGDIAYAIGQRIAPSAGDLEGIASLYATDLSVVAQTYPGPAGTEIDVFVTNEVAQGAHGIQLNVSTASGDGLSLNETGSWDCDSSSSTQLVCVLDRLSAGGSEGLSLTALTQADNISVHAYVQSKTADSDLSNNGSAAGAMPIALPSQLIPNPVQVSEDSIAHDTVAHVSTAGAVGFWWAVLSLLVGSRQARRRIDNQLT